MVDILPVLQSIYVPPTQVVSVRSSLTAPWETLTGVFCDSFTAVAKPHWGQAQFSYRAGVGMALGDEQQIKVHSPLTIDQYQVRLQLYDGTDGSLLASWYGIIVADERELLGSTVDLSGTLRANMWQTFTAVDMGYLLDKVRVTHSWVEGLADPIGRGIAFNAGRGSARDTNIVARANRSAEEIGTAGYAFAADLATASLWTNYDIAQYLARNFRPQVANTDVDIAFTNDSHAITWDTPLVRSDGRTVKSIFDELFDRRRMYGWAADWDGTNDRLSVKVFSYADEEFDLASGEQVPANPNQVTFNFDRAFDVASATLRRVSNRRDRVVIHGARRGAVFTISKADGTLEADWTSTNQSAYNSGASGATSPAYSSLDNSEKIKRNRLVRTSPTLARVYRNFRIPTSWNFTANNGENGLSDYPVLPKLSNDTAQGTITGASAPLWRPGLVLEQYLPLAEGHDYTSLPATNNLPDGTVPDPLPVQVYLKTPTTANDSSTSRWVTGDELIAADVEDQAGEGGQRWRVSVRVQQQNLGLVVDVVGGEQHYIADTEFSPLSNVDKDAILDWQTDMLATVYLETDQRVTVAYPSAQQVSGAGVTTLEIFADEYRLDYLAPGTVVGVDDGVLERNNNGGFLRDDRTLMENHAKAAYEWYKRTRAELDVSVRTVLPIASIGDMVTAIGTEEAATYQEVNTPITQITVALGNRGSGHPPLTTIRTSTAVESFGDLQRGNGRQREAPPHLLPRRGLQVFENLPLNLNGHRNAPTFIPPARPGTNPGARFL